MAHENTVKIFRGGVVSSERKVRDSNLELYRIITMLLIVAHHYVVNSGLMDAGGPIYADPLSWRSLFLSLFGAWGKTGINCFVLITGYFMCQSHITARKFAKLFFEWMFYRLIIQAIFWITGYESFSLKTALLLLIPVKQISTGFTSCYIVFFLFIPFLNALIQNLTERQHVYLLLLCGFTYIVLGTIHSVTMNYVTWFIVLYLIASYIRLYPKKLYENQKLWGWLALTSILLSIVSVFACAWLSTKRQFFLYYFVNDSNTFLAVLTGISSFLFFKNLKMNHSRLINTFSASTFGVLLIHAHSDTMRQWLWKDTLNNVGNYNSPFMPFHAIGSVIGIFIICAAIDQIRIRFIEKPFFKFWDKHWNGFLSKFKSLEAKVFSKLGIQE